MRARDRGGRGHHRQRHLKLHDQGSGLGDYGLHRAQVGGGQEVIRARSENYPILPPGIVWKSLPVMVSPASGKREARTTRSIFKLPITVMVDMVQPHQDTAAEIIRPLH